MTLGRARDVRGDIALGLAQADDQEHLRARRADLAEVLLVFLRVAPSRPGALARVCPVRGAELAAVFRAAGPRVPIAGGQVVSGAVARGEARAEVAYTAGEEIAVIFELARVAPQIPAPPDAQDLHVGLDRLQRAEQREEPRALAVFG